MAIKLMKVNNSFNIQIQHFYIDNISDLDIIEDEYECQIGDIAELPDGAKYRRHSDDYSGNLWEYYTGGGSSGNSSLPSIDEEDIGKNLSVIEDLEKDQVIMPEQTANERITYFENVDFSLFQIGEPIIVIINGKEYITTMETDYEDGSWINIETINENDEAITYLFQTWARPLSEEDTSLYFDERVKLYISGKSGDKFSIYTTKKSVKWDKAGGGDDGGGVDAVFRYSCDWDNVLGYINWTAELVSGSFEAAQAKAVSGQPMRFLSMLYLPEEGNIRDYTMTAFGAPGGYYTSAVAAPLTGTFVLRDYLWTDRANPGITVEWSSDGTIIVTQD